LTNTTANAQVLIRLIGDKSTSFFPLEYSRRLFSGSFYESFYCDNESINEVRKNMYTNKETTNLLFSCIK